MAAEPTSTATTSATSRPFAAAAGEKLKKQKPTGQVVVDLDEVDDDDDEKEENA